MPRIAGQIDQAKSEAMLDAAGAVIAERGFGASVEAIARRAGVSKQTLYNHFGGKEGLIQALVRRRVDVLTSPLAEGAAGGDPETVLTAFARVLIDATLSPAKLSALRLAIQGAVEVPEMGRLIYEAGAQTSRSRLADYLRGETQAGRLAVDDPEEAAELFAAMTGGQRLRGLLGLPVSNDPASVARMSRAIAHRFVRAYAP
ncbi:MAG: TetR/AcrR family transcriptional regulator [Caulobacteraceae bacterium]|nr:TetR/AcrR family transcriptional regulator [Caulobacteraceae bacterium]